MGRRYLIYVACGSAAASSTLVKSRLADMLHDQKLDVNIEIMRISELASHIAAQKPDLAIITAGAISKQGLPEGVPVMSGLPLMTMMGVHEFIEKVKGTLLAAG